MNYRFVISALLICTPFADSLAEKHPNAAPGVTSLTNPTVAYEILTENHFTLKRNGVTAIIVDNSSLDLPGSPGHRARYNGIASLTHEKHPRNLFVPAYAGLNFEHIHDGTTANLKNKFEPREFPMQLRHIDEHTVELYQSPTGHWKLESCGRYHMLEDGVIEYSFECIPRKGGYVNDFIGLFWASYIDQPEDTAIHFPGRLRVGELNSSWIKSISPAHGVASTHQSESHKGHLPRIDKEFPLSLVNHASPYIYTKPFYYGVSHKMAFVQIFRARDNIWFAQSPSGGGNSNPAWDFQIFIRKPKVNEAYGFIMRAAYLPFQSGAQIEGDITKHMKALNPPMPEK